MKLDSRRRRWRSSAGGGACRRRPSSEVARAPCRERLRSRAWRVTLAALEAEGRLAADRGGFAPGAPPGRRPEGPPEVATGGRILSELRPAAAPSGRSARRRRWRPCDRLVVGYARALSATFSARPCDRRPVALLPTTAAYTCAADDEALAGPWPLADAPAVGGLRLGLLIGTDLECPSRPAAGLRRCRSCWHRARRPAPRVGATAGRRAPSRMAAAGRRLQRPHAQAGFAGLSTPTAGVGAMAGRRRSDLVADALPLGRRQDARGNRDARASPAEALPEAYRDRREPDASGARLQSAAVYPTAWTPAAAPSRTDRAMRYRRGRCMKTILVHLEISPVAQFGAADAPPRGAALRQLHRRPAHAPRPAGHHRRRRRRLRRRRARPGGRASSGRRATGAEQARADLRGLHGTSTACQRADWPAAALSADWRIEVISGPRARSAASAGSST